MVGDPEELQPDTPPAAGDVEPGGGLADAAAPAPSLRETLDAAVREAREPAETHTNRDRASGRFVPKADDGPKVAAAPTVGQGPPASSSASQSPAATSETPAAPSTAPAGPPPGWAADAKALYPSLPPAVQAAVSRREEEVSRGFAQHAQRQRELEQVIGPRRQHYASEGISDTQAINNLWTWFEALKNSPADSFPALAETFGYNLSPNAAASQSQVNPEYARLAAEMAQLRGQVGQVTGTFEQQQTAARRAELASFAKDKPHFEKVRVTMGKLMQAQLATGLDDAYQQAVKLVPEVTAAIAADDARKAAEDALKVRGGSRRAAVSVRGGSPNGAAGPAVPTSIRDNLREGFAAARGG